ncbi:MAG: hypothetical protein M1826_000221 [Phylliscum demangeonii]|nr:MAG: hypothetical protein M1826_000221 [Phylliscum demangeonii]
MAWFTPSSSSSRHRHHYATSSSSSYHRRRPRDGFIQRMLHQLRRLVRDLLAFARRNPVKFFMMVVMPLLTGGALHAVLRQFGIRLPNNMFGGGNGQRPSGGDYAYSRYSGRSSLGDLVGGGSGGGGGGLAALFKVAQAFM